MKNFKKLFAIIATMAIVGSTVPTAVLGAAGYSDELEGAYDYAYENGVTTQSSIETANMYGSLIRSHMAKMMANYAIEVLGQTPDTDATCEFTDIANETEELQDAMVTACQLGLMGQGITAFNPNGVVTRAQFGTVLSRALWGDTNNDGDPYYANHLQALKDAGIMNNISNPNAVEVRGYVMLMLQRADEGVTSEICETEENVLACSLGLDTCPAECEEEEEVKAGTLAVSMESAEGMDVPYGITSLNVGTYILEAGDEDVELNSLTLEQAGYSDAGTLDNVALFIDGQRVSKTPNISTDDELSLDLTDTYTIKAGETVEIAVNVTVGGTGATDNTSADGDKFSIELTEVDSSAKDVEYDDNLTTDMFTVLSKGNDTVALTAGSSVDSPMLGSTAAELFEFDLDNSDNDQNVSFKSITFKTTDTDFADYFENFELQVDGETIATTEGMNGKYLTFNVEDGYTIEDTDNQSFTVVADVISMNTTSESIVFSIENVMDVIVMGTKYDVPTTITAAAMKAFTISAGDVTLTKTNPGSTAIVRDRTNLALGAFTITNKAGGDIKLQDFDLDFADMGTGNVDYIIKNVKVRLGSTTASLKTLDTANNIKWTIDGLAKDVGSKLIVYVYADTENVDMTDTAFKMTLNNVVIQESGEDNDVEVSPTSLTFNQMNGSDSVLKFTSSYLAPASVAKGSQDVDAMKFTVKTSTTEGAKLTKMTFTALNNTVAVDSDIVNGATLYYGDNEVDLSVKSGSVVLYDDITLAKNTTTTFTLKVSLDDNATGAFRYGLASTGCVEAEDTSTDHNSLNQNPAIVGKLITVKAAGAITMDYDASINTNKYAKNILAGDENQTVAEYSVRASYTEVNVDEAKVVFTTDVQDAMSNVSLWYNGDKIEGVPTWSTDGTTATFTDLDFDVLKTEGTLLVKVDTITINNQAGVTLPTAAVSTVTLTPSDDEVDAEIATGGQTFGIVPVTITTSRNGTDVIATADRGSNTTTANLAAKAYISGLNLTVNSNNGGLTSLALYDGSTQLATWTVTTASHDFTFTGVLATANLTVQATESGSITNPSYKVTLNNVSYYTNVNGTGTVLTDRGGAGKVLFNK